MDPIPDWIKRLWNVGDVRVLILLSLGLQITLSVFGSRRKSSTSIWIRIIVWLAYLGADSVAIFALGNLSSAQVLSDSNNALMAIWAPLLLLHLGGPDTITAYSMADNKLWLRHLLGLGVQFTLALYAIAVSWNSSSSLSFLTLPVLISGIIKYGERTWALKSANDGVSPEVNSFSPIDAEVAVVAHYALSLFRPHSEGYIINGASSDDISEWFQSCYKWWLDTPKLLWMVFEVEMGFMYDILYTKGIVVYTKTGCIIRSISFFSTVLASIGFFLIYFVEDKTSDHNSVDIIITGVLLVFAVVLEIYAVTVALCSDWMVLWLILHHNGAAKLFSFFQKSPNLNSLKRRWSDSIGQFNLITFCLRNEPKVSIRKSLFSLFSMEEEFSKYRHKTSEMVPQFLKELIISYVSVSSEFPSNTEDFVMTTASFLKVLRLPLEHNLPPFKTSGELALRQWKGDKIMNSIMRAGFGERICILYIATKILLYDYGSSSEVSSCEEVKVACKILAEYMAYLMLYCPSLLPKSFTIERSLSQLKAVMQNAPSEDEGQACKFAAEAFNVLAENLKRDDLTRVCELLELALSGMRSGSDTLAVERKIHSKLQEALLILDTRSLEGDQCTAQKTLEEACEVLKFLQDLDDNSSEYTVLAFLYNFSSNPNIKILAQNIAASVEHAKDMSYTEKSRLDGALHVKTIRKTLKDAAREDLEVAIRILRTSCSSGHEGNKASELSDEALKLLNQLVTERKQGSQLLFTIAEVLQCLKELQGRGQSWLEFLSKIWLEMLCYAANECPQNNHIEQLKEGGELLTLVWLLIKQRYPSNRSIWWNMDLRDKSPRNGAFSGIWNQELSNPEDIEEIQGE